jgi:hypothetical protein
MVHGRFSYFGLPVNWIAAGILRIVDSILVEQWNVIQDEASREQSKSGLRASETLLLDSMGCRTTHRSGAVWFRNDRRKAGIGLAARARSESQRQRNLTENPGASQTDATGIVCEPLVGSWPYRCPSSPTMPRVAKNQARGMNCSKSAATC